MIANEEYTAALADLKNFCAKETAFDVEFLTNVYPLVAVFKPKAQLSLFDKENYNVDDNGEIGSIQIAFGTTTRVQSSLRFKMDAKLLKKFIKLTEKVGLLYLHAFFEEQAAGTYEAWLEEQAKASDAAAAIKQAAENARNGEQNAEYRVEVYVYNLLEKEPGEPQNLSDLDYEITGTDLAETKKKAHDHLVDVCKEHNVEAGKTFDFEIFSYCGEERIDGDEGSATWNGSEVNIDL